MFAFYCFSRFLTVHLCTVSQISPTRRTVLFNIFIYLFLFSTCFGIHVPIIGRKLLYLCDAGICHSVWVASGLLVGLNSIQPAEQTPRVESDKYHCRIDIAIFSRWWARGCPKRVDKRNILKRTVHQVGFIYEIIQGCRSTERKISWNLQAVYKLELTWKWFIPVVCVN